MDGPQQHDGRQNLVSLSKFWIRYEASFFSRKLTDILFYVRDIPQSTRTISEYNLIKWCQWDHLLDRILMGLRVRAAGLKVLMVSMTIWCVNCALGALCPLAILGQSCVIWHIFCALIVFDWYLGRYQRNWDVRTPKIFLRGYLVGPKYEFVLIDKGIVERVAVSFSGYHQ